MTTHACGCVNAIDARSGVLRCVRKCPGHRRDSRAPAQLGRDYYAAFGVLDEGDGPADTPHFSQLTEGLGDIPVPPRSDAYALEVGCGVSPYCRPIRERGYTYIGLDPSPWAALWMARHHGVTVDVGCLDAWDRRRRPDLILAAHCLEHMDDAPAAVARLAGMLAPGGELWIVVPDDSDPTNPDHLWFFLASTLRRCVESAGLEVVRTATRKYIDRENFIYLRARKSG